MKNKVFLKIGLLSALIPLLGGLTIFIVWLIARNCFGIRMNGLITVGIYWLLASAFIALIGLFLTALFIVKNRKLGLYKAILCVILILTNIPIAIIIEKQAELISNRAYIRIFNKTTQENLQIAFKGAYYNQNIENIKNGDYKVLYFTPKYSNLSLQRTGIVDSFFIEIQYRNEFKRMLLPPIYQEDFLKITLNENFEIETENE